jgi:hypothetical protein
MSVHEASDTLREVVALPRLDVGTQLVGLRWWPDAGEAVAFFAPMDWSREEVEDVETNRVSLDPRAVEERRQENRERAARRARARLRRYVVANGLSRMVTLTFAPTVRGAHGEPACGQRSTGEPPGSLGGASSPQVGGWCSCGRPRGPLGLVEAMAAAAEFVRDLRALVRVEAMPYAVVPEYHEDGHVHVHCLVDRFVAKDAIASVWSHGFVDVRRFKRANGGARAAARRAAAYACKYVAKTFDQERADELRGRHRYEVGEGFQPTVIKRGGYRSLADAIRFVTDHGSEVIYAVSSDALVEYDGPPFLWVVVEAVAA